MAQLRRLREQFPNELVIISVHSAKFPTEKSTVNIRQAAMRHGVDHPLVNDADFKVWQSYAVKAWPTVVLIDPQGKLVHTQSGEILAEEFASKIEVLITEAEVGGQLDRTPLEVRPERMAEPMRPLNYPAKLLPGPDDNLFIADTGHHRILEVKLTEAGLSGEIERIFGSGQPGLKDGPANEAMFHDPHGLALKGQTLYVADTENHAIRAIDLADNTVRTVAGTGEKAHGRLALGSPTEVPLRSPWALLAEDEILLIAMAGSHQIWALVGESRLGIFAGNGYEALIDGPLLEASFNQPSDLTYGYNHLFVADAEASAIRAIALEEEAKVQTLIGQGLFEFGDIDGMGRLVRLQHPLGLTFADGLIYIADSYNHKIKVHNPTTSEVQTLIGAGRPGQADGPFAEAELFEPAGVMAAGHCLYIADTNNHLIRVADLERKTLHTLRLQGLEKLNPSSISASNRPAERLARLTVGLGRVEIPLKIVLTGGYKLNDTAAHHLHYVANGLSIEQSFKAEETPTIRLDLDSDRELALDLTLYYCQTDDQRLCMIHQARLILPLTVSAEADRRVQAVYKIPG